MGITIRFYHDTRGVPAGKEAPLKLAVTKNSRTALLPLGVSLTAKQWDKTASKVMNHPRKQSINMYIQGRKLEAETELLRMIQCGETSHVGATEIKNRLKRFLEGEGNQDSERYLLKRIRTFAESGNKKPGTKILYDQTVRRLIDFRKDAESITLDDINKDFLMRFEAFLSATESKNARNIHLRNIRAVFNDAIDNELTTNYPFRKFRIRPEATAKRSLSVEQLRTLFDYPVEEYARLHLDMFKLIFYLIGINMADLYALEGITQDGRIEYNRAKTRRFYSIKVEPEALSIINMYRGSGGHLIDIADRHKDHRNYLKHINDALQHIGETNIGKRGKKEFHPLFPGLTTYWARHTWATIAASLDIPKETIAAALGHGGNTVTDIYIDFDRRKIDEANRKVIDWVLYGRR
ncbi:MAG: phage integrase SAM-like domain-containing protein [Parabacteroides sp.]